MKTFSLVLASLPFIAASNEAATACRNIPGDAGWPSEAEWKAQLPNSVARGAQKAMLHPDYRIDAKSVDDVIAAVKFAAKHNIRLTAIHSGHDGLGRNDAPSGLLLGMEGLTGMRVEETFTPSVQGQPKVAAAPATAPAAAPAAAAPAAAPAGGAPHGHGGTGHGGMLYRKRHGPDGDDEPKPAGTKRHGPDGDDEPKPAGTKRHGPDRDDEPKPAGTKRHGPDEPVSAPKGSAPPSTAAPAPPSGKVPYAVTLGAGMTTQDINDKIAAQGIFTNGAEHGEVGVAGGWSQCGGHGPMTTAYGLGSDNVLEFQVVTADGQLKIANEVANPDLYWALRGGCGSTFGIVTQVTVRAYPSPKFTVTKFNINATTEDGIFEPMAYLHSVMPDLIDKGVQGYYLAFPKKFTAIFHTVGTLATEEASKKLWEPVLAKVATFPNIQKESAVATYLSYPSYKTYFDATWGAADGDHKKRSLGDSEMIHDWWTGEYVRRSERHSLRKRHGPGEKSLPKGTGKVGGDGRLLDKETLQSPKLAAALKAAMPAKGMMRGVLVGGSIIKKSPTETSVHPSWRKSYASIWSDKDVNEIATLAKGMGAYVNEASYNASNWQEVFWGSNYPKLSEIKTKYDPNMVFYSTPGINAEQMMANEKGALCTAPEAVRKSALLFPPAGDNPNVKAAKKPM